MRISDWSSDVCSSDLRVTLSDGKTVNLTIPPGTEDGTVLRLKGQGKPAAGGKPAGDAYLELLVEPHAFYRRDGRDIHLDLPVTLKEAVLGASVTVPTVHGNVSLKIPRGANSEIGRASCRERVCQSV